MQRLPFFHSDVGFEERLVASPFPKTLDRLEGPLPLDLNPKMGDPSFDLPPGLPPKRVTYTRVSTDFTLPAYVAKGGERAYGRWLAEQLGQYLKT